MILLFGFYGLKIVVSTVRFCPSPPFPDPSPNHPLRRFAVTTGTSPQCRCPTDRANDRPAVHDRRKADGDGCDGAVAAAGRRRRPVPRAWLVEIRGTRPVGPHVRPDWLRPMV